MFYDLEYISEVTQRVLAKHMFGIRDKCLTVYLTHPHCGSLLIFALICGCDHQCTTASGRPLQVGARVERTVA